LRDNGLVNGQLIHLARPGRARRFWRFAWSQSPPATPTRRQVAADAVLAAAIAGASVTTVVLIARTAGHGTPVPVAQGPAVAAVVWKHGALLAAAARAAPLAIRRLRPLTAFWLCLAACLTLTGLPGINQANLIALVPAAYSAVAYSRYRGAALLSMPAAVLVLAVAPAAVPVSGNYMLLTAGLVVTPAVTVGNAMRVLHQRARESVVLLTRLEAEQEDATRRAVALERSRIASELHDVVTHNVSMMVVQAGAGRRVLTAAPEDARSALLAIEESGRAAIVELQHLLGLLGQPEDGSLTGADSAPLQPQPGLDRLPSLIDRVTAAGVPVELRVTGAMRALPQGIDLAAYRIIQEALTNVIKHAGQPQTTVTIRYDAGAVAIEVADEGHPRAAAQHRLAEPGAAGTTPGGPGATAHAGRGLLGLRERVSLYGGELAAGRHPGGGWLVRAHIPDQPALAPDQPALASHPALP
jgi:signal transduction histidine kinase